MQDIYCHSLFWDKPKYALPDEEYQNLLAEQILKKKDCEKWEIVK